MVGKWEPNQLAVLGFPGMQVDLCKRESVQLHLHVLFHFCFYELCLLPHNCKTLLCCSPCFNDKMLACELLGIQLLRLTVSLTVWESTHTHKILLFIELCHQTPLITSPAPAWHCTEVRSTLLAWMAFFCRTAEAACVFYCAHLTVAASWHCHFGRAHVFWYMEPMLFLKIWGVSPFFCCASRYAFFSCAAGPDSDHYPYD